MLAASQDALELMKRGFKVRWMTWREHYPLVPTVGPSPRGRAWQIMGSPRHRMPTYLEKRWFETGAG